MIYAVCGMYNIYTVYIQCTYGYPVPYRCTTYILYLYVPICCYAIIVCDLNALYHVYPLLFNDGNAIPLTRTYIGDDR